MNSLNMRKRPKSWKLETVDWAEIANFEKYLPIIMLATFWFRVVLRRIDGLMLLDVDVFKFVDEVVEIVEDGFGRVLLSL